MKIAFTSTGKDWESEIDSVFGRAAGFLLYDSNKNELTWHSNEQNRNAGHGAVTALRWNFAAEIRRRIQRQLEINADALERAGAHVGTRDVRGVLCLELEIIDQRSRAGIVVRGKHRHTPVKPATGPAELRIGG